MLVELDVVVEEVLVEVLVELVVDFVVEVVVDIVVEVVVEVVIAASTLTATNILASATSPALVVAIVSKFSLAGIVIAAEICPLSMLVTVEFVTVPPPSACSRVTSEVDPSAAADWK